MTDHPRMPRALACAAVLLAVNLAIAAKLFGVEYSAYNGSVESTFIAIARVMAQHPLHWSWWPLWTVGMPFENSYLPFMQWLVAGLTVLTGFSPAKSFHIVTAAFYVLGPVTFFWMLLVLSRKLAASFAAALAYSCVSFSVLLVPAIRLDAGSALGLRRLQDLVVYGEAPHTVALTLLPVAIVCFHRALTTNAMKWKILAGVLAACAVLSNAFAIAVLAIALLCWLMAFRPARWWRAVATIMVIAVAAFCWISPWLSPSMIRAILNAPNIDGDYRYTTDTWIALAVFGAGYQLLCLILRGNKAAPALQFVVLFGYVFAGIVGIWYNWQIALLPQPHRYQLEMDMALAAALIFLGSAIIGRWPKWLGVPVAVVAGAALGFQAIHSVGYARGIIRAADHTQLSEYKVAKWLDQNRRGQRAFIGGSGSFLYNVFTDNPQIRGGHAQFETNSFIHIVDFTVYTGTNAGNRDAEYSIFWLKAFGAHAIYVSGPGSTEFYKPYVHPHKFDGVLPLVWRQGGDSIYEVPSRSASLAHVMPASAIVARRPAHGLDIAPAAAYVAALDDARYPPATFEWKGMSAADIHATVGRGQVVAVQESYGRGWEAWANGRRLNIRPDGLGLMVIEPDCTGACEISLRYTGGIVRIATRFLSLAAMLFAALCAWRWGRLQRLP